MLFWLAVIGGAAVSYAALKKGFFPIWAVCFNTLVSVYLGVMLLPIIAAVIPNSGTAAYFYSCSLCMLAVAVIAFVFLQTIASNYFSGGFAVTFPVVFNNIVADSIIKDFAQQRRYFLDDAEKPESPEEY